MLEFPVPANVQTDQLRVEIRDAQVEVGNIYIAGGDTLCVVADEADKAAVEAAIAAHVPDPDWRPTVAERDWRTKLEAEIVFIGDQLSTWPPDATTNAQAIQRVNFLLVATRRLARNQERILRWIHDQEMDAS